MMIDLLQLKRQYSLEKHNQALAITIAIFTPMYRQIAGRT